MGLDEIDFSLFKLAQSIKLKHLYKALRCFLDNADFVLKAKKLNASVKVIKDFINEFADLTLVSLHDFIELCKDLVNDIQQCLSAPVLLVSQHVLDNSMSLINDFKLSQLLKI